MKIIKQSEIKKSNIILFLCAIGLFILSDGIKLYTQTSGGGYSSSYLLREVGARPIALGGAYTAVSNDPYAIFYNPAGLGFFPDRPQVNTSVSSIGLDRYHSSLAWAQQVIDNIGLGFGINSMNSPSFKARDITGAPIKDISNHEYAITATGSYKIESASIGVSLKYLNSSLIGTDTYANGFAVDIGTKFNIMDLFSFGLAARNIGGRLMWNNLNEDSEVIPFTIRSGIAMEYGFNDKTYETRSTVTGELETVYVPATRYILLSFDAVFDQYRTSPDMILGVEAAVHEMLAFRGGINIYGEDEGKPSLLPMSNWGAGVSVRPFDDNEQIPFDAHFDYTISREYISGNKISHNISILFLF